MKLEQFSESYPDTKIRRAANPVTKADQEVLAKVYGRPRAPPGTTGYHLFCSEFQRQQRQTQHDSDSENNFGSTWMTRASAEWKSFSDAQRNDYNSRIKAVCSVDYCYFLLLLLYILSHSVA